MKTPVLLLVYNRPTLVEAQLTLLINQSEVGQIFISGDGAKSTDADQAKVAAVQKVVKSFIQKSPSRFKVHFSSKNQGCRSGVEAGIDWFFGHVPEGIILEDDCQPDPSFFRYCAELLEVYRDDQRIGMISGTKPVLHIPISDSYFFSRHSMVWGWATWKRAWQAYHQTKKDGLSILQEPSVRAAVLEIITPSQLKVIERVLIGQIDTWDYIWYLTNILQARFCILPKTNVISNQGFQNDATHTKLKTTQSELPVTALSFPLRHPRGLVVTTDFERTYLAHQQRWQVLLSVFLAYGRLGWKKLRT
jgi:hypothetical protein